MSSAACGFMGVAYAHTPGACMPCGAWPTPRIGCRVWWVRVSPSCSWRRSPRMSSHRCCQVCVWSLGLGVGDDDGLPWGGAWLYRHRCRRRLRGYVDGVGGAALTESPSVGVIVESPWTVRRRWWRPVSSAQVVVGSVIEWRRMGWIPGVISSHRSVPLWTAHSRGRSRNPFRSGVVRCCGGGSILVMGWVRGSVRGLSCVVGGDGAWGISSSSCCGAFASWSSALMVVKTSGRVGEAGGWGAGSLQVMWYSSGFSGLCCTVMAAVASSSGVHRCGLWWRGWRLMVWRCFQLWNARRAWRPCLMSPGGRG